MRGYEKLEASVIENCNDRNNCGCFNPDGCNVKNGRKEEKSCFHLYCDKFKWVIERAKHYAEKTGLKWEDILDSWESKRNYWYMSYYQECNQPLLKGDSVRVFDTVDEMLLAIGERKFRCPSCGGVSTNPYRCNSGELIVRNPKKKEICNWSVHGLFGDLGKGASVYCKDKLAGETIFMPLAWEDKGVE